MLRLFVRLCYPLLFKLLLIPLVTMSQSIISQCENFTGRCVISDQDPATRTCLMWLLFLSFYSPTSYHLSSGKTIVNYMWWNIPDSVYLRIANMIQQRRYGFLHQNLLTTLRRQERLG